MFQFSIALCKDLEIARMFAELTRKQEVQKLKQAQIIHEIISSLVFPYVGELCSAFERIMAQVALIILLRCVMLTNCRSPRVFQKSCVKNRRTRLFRCHQETDVLEGYWREVG